MPVATTPAPPLPVIRPVIRAPEEPTSMSPVPPLASMPALPPVTVMALATLMWMAPLPPLLMAAMPSRPAITLAPPLTPALIVMAPALAVPVSPASTRMPAMPVLAFTPAVLTRMVSPLAVPDVSATMPALTPETRPVELIDRAWPPRTSMPTPSDVEPLRAFKPLEVTAPT